MIVHHLLVLPVLGRELSNIFYLPYWWSFQ